MAFIIIDLEFNNLRGIGKHYPNYEEDYPSLLDPELENEIIEIGAVKVDNYMQPIAELKAFIKPKLFPFLNPEIIKITGINEEDLAEGITFEEGMDKLREMVDEGDIICSWAKDDITEIINNAIYHNYTDLHWLKNYLDIQEYATKILAFKKSLSLKNALDILKIRVDKNKLHDALNDAIFTSYVLKSIYNSRIIKNYIIENISELPLIAIKDLSKCNLEEDKIDSQCPKCKIKFEIEYPLKAMRWRYVSLGECPKCKNKIINEVIIKKTISGQEVYKEISTILSPEEYIKYSYRM